MKAGDGMTTNGTDHGELHAKDGAKASPMSLPQIGKDAADHLASARAALGAARCDSAAALAHLDAALSCLKRVTARGATGTSERPARLDTAAPARRSA